MKNSEDKLKSRLKGIEKTISEFADRKIKIAQTEKQGESRLKKKITEPQGPVGL